MSQAESHNSTESAYPAGLLADAEDYRVVAARSLIPAARHMREQVRALADMVSRFERRFGAENIQHFARLADDLWMAADNFVCDIEPQDADHQLAIAASGGVL